MQKKKKKSTHWKSSASLLRVLWYIWEISTGQGGEKKEQSLCTHNGLYWTDKLISSFPIFNKKTLKKKLFSSLVLSSHILRLNHIENPGQMWK